MRDRTRAEQVALTARFAARVGPLLATQRLQAIVERVFALDDIAAAHAYMERNANFGEIVIEVVPAPQ